MLWGIYVGQAAALIALSWIGIVASPISIVGVGLLYWAEGFLVLSTLWWGLGGLLGTYVGTVVGAGLLTGIPLVPSLVFGLSDTVAALVAFVAYRGYVGRRGLSPFGSDVLSTGRAARMFIVWVLLVTNFVGALLGVVTLVGFALLPYSEFGYVLGAWALGDAIELAVFLPVVSAYVTPALERKGWLNMGWLF